jgi:hypothetical protein
MFRVPEDVVFEVLDGEAVLLNLKTGVYFTLNETGTRVWQLLREHGEPEAIRAAMRDEFDISPEALKADVARVIEDLVAKGLVVVDGED